MPRFFVDSEQLAGTKVYIQGEDVKHISKVLRLRAGDLITVCDKQKTDYECEVAELSSDRVVCEIIDKHPNRAEAEIDIVLYQGMPKSDKMDYIVQKCVELGAVKIVPVITKRAVSRPSDGEKKVVRWQKIAAEAAKQCGRGIIPEIGDIISFDEAVLCMQNDADALNLMPYECEGDKKLRDILVACGKKRVNIFIGPEGGFDDMEAAVARNKGIATVTLGPRILRTETAPLAVITAVMYELGDW
ncbi:MAG: 16S rRNA (uracil(1498)-N(3))-methyltransferase [Oscillospiraceae bacterium]|nr:16S rRNA (uracil(1498)-N(3))-methyltransferase [Oscillospiraceae bacterium]